MSHAIPYREDAATAAVFAPGDRWRVRGARDRGVQRPGVRQDQVR